MGGDRRNHSRWTENPPIQGPFLLCRKPGDSRSRPSPLESKAPRYLTSDLSSEGPTMLWICPELPVRRSRPGKILKPCH